MKISLPSKAEAGARLNLAIIALIKMVQQNLFDIMS